MKPADTSDPQPHTDAPLWVWHMWLCHGSDATGHDCETPCKDGCDITPDPSRLRRYLRQPSFSALTVPQSHRPAEHPRRPLTPTHAKRTSR